MTTPLADWTEVIAGVHVRQSRAFRMNSVVLVDRAHTVVIDPGVLPTELDDIAHFVAGAAPEQVTLLFTHSHWDHVLGRPWFPDAHTIAHDQFAGEVRKDQEQIAREAQEIAAKYGETWTHGFEAFRPDEAMSGLRFLKLDPWRLVLRDAPGHSHTQLTVHLPDRRLLVSADMLSNIEIPILDGPVAPFRDTLQELQLLAENGAILTVVPGHGAVAGGRNMVLERFKRDLEYLGALDKGVRDALQKGLSLEGTRQQLASLEYAGKHSTEYPTEPLHLDNIRFAYEAHQAGRR
jgi:glyoxylase-like metal-dependent hydrolase (beta-lactamase superfamily II)